MTYMRDKSLIIVSIGDTDYKYYYYYFIFSQSTVSLSANSVASPSSLLNQYPIYEASIRNTRLRTKAERHVLFASLNCYLSLAPTRESSFSCLRLSYLPFHSCQYTQAALPSAHARTWRALNRLSPRPVDGRHIFYQLLRQ